MPKRFAEYEHQVFTAYRDLIDFAAPEKVREFEDTVDVHTEWPGYRENTCAILSIGVRGIVPIPFTTLTIRFEEGGDTIMPFNRDTGKLHAVHRFVGEISARSFFSQDLRLALHLAPRATPTDYKILIDELRHGYAYLRQKPTD